MVVNGDRIVLGRHVDPQVLLGLNVRAVVVVEPYRGGIVVTRDVRGVVTHISEESVVVGDETISLSDLDGLFADG